MLNNNKIINDIDTLKIKSSIYVLQDTQLVLEFYIKKIIKNEFENHLDKIAYSYLITYGLLQALILQQDAISIIANKFNVNIEKDFSNYPVLKDIRIIRNDSIGHPAIRYDGSKNFVSQTSVNNEGFDYTKVIDSVSVIEKVRYKEIISQQFDEIEKIIIKILEQIDTQYNLEKD